MDQCYCLVLEYWSGSFDFLAIVLLLDFLDFVVTIVKCPDLCFGRRVVGCVICRSYRKRGDLESSKGLENAPAGGGEAGEAIKGAIEEVTDTASKD